MVRHPYTALFADRYPLFSIMMPRPQDITAQLLCHFRSDWPRFCREGRIDRAAKIIDVSSPTVYRWKRAGNLRGARGVDVLRVHDLTGIELELLLGSDPLPVSGGRTIWRTQTGTRRGKGR